MTLVIAICPSLQDRNMSNLQPDGFPPYNEAGNNQWFAREKLLPAMLAAGIQAVVFAPWNESEDVNRGGPLSGLREQMRLAKEWLDNRAEGWGAVLSLHTDSGAVGHTWGLHGVGLDREVDSARLAHDVSARVTRAFGRKHYVVFTKLGDKDYSQYIFWLNTAPYTSMLLEMCSHQNREDLAVLYQQPDALAALIVQGVLAWGLEAAAAPVSPPSGDADRIRRVVSHLNAAVGEINTWAEALPT
jgi:hypothetical protein